MLNSPAFRRPRSRAPGYFFEFDVRDFGLTLPEGVEYDYQRDGERHLPDNRGVIGQLAKHQLPWAHQYRADAGVYEPVLAMLGDANNNVKSSEAFGSEWSSVGTPSLVAAAHKCGDLSLDLIGDDSAGAVEGYSQTFPLLGHLNLGQEIGLSLFVAKGTSTSSVIRLRDTDASVNRLLAALTWSGATPVVTMANGQVLDVVPYANDVWRLLLSSEVLDDDNAHELAIYPATTSALANANTGNLYVGGVHLEYWRWPRAYVRTTTNARGASGDEIRIPIRWRPQDLTFYCKFIRPYWTAGTWATGDHEGYLLYLGQPSAGPLLRVRVSTSQVLASIGTNPISQSGAAAALPSGTILEACVQVTNFRTGGTVRIDVGSGFGTPAGPIGPVTEWDSDPEIFIGGFNGQAIETGIMRYVIAPGLRTMAELRGPL